MDCIWHLFGTSTRNDHLCEAVKKGDLEKVRILLAHGENINCTDHKTNFGQSPLILASYGGHLEVVKELLAHRPRIDQADRRMNRTSLYWASVHGTLEIVNELLAHGANANTIDWVRQDCTIDDTIEEASSAMHFDLHVGLNGRAPLRVAASSGHTEIVKELLDHGASVEPVDKVQPAPENSFYGYLEIINELLAHGVPLDVGGKNGYTPLHAASLRGQLGALRLLLNAGADPSLKNEHGDTARDCGDDEVKTFFDNYPNIDENILETKAMTERKQASKLPPRFYFPI
ncbi:hypothetical protein LEN26_009697 [Aphanomyces euteiches]|nr:hypothetical protein LEN26_009697 [Aphanomyces euteiches]